METHIITDMCTKVSGLCPACVYCVVGSRVVVSPLSPFCICGLGDARGVFTFNYTALTVALSYQQMETDDTQFYLLGTPVKPRPPSAVFHLKTNTLVIFV